MKFLAFLVSFFTAIQFTYAADTVSVKCQNDTQVRAYFSDVAIACGKWGPLRHCALAGKSSKLNKRIPFIDFIPANEEVCVISAPQGLKLTCDSGSTHRANFAFAQLVSSRASFGIYTSVSGFLPGMQKGQSLAETVLEGENCFLTAI